MDFTTPLIPATLIRRYKRFLADVRLDDGAEMTVHCANPGAMMGITDPGLRIWLEDSRNPRRRLRYSWKLAELPDGSWCGVDTGVPNRVVSEALCAGRVPALRGYADIRAEVKYGRNSRIDFLMTGPGMPDTYVEVKNVHLIRKGNVAEFPDCVTERGAKHLRELSGMVAAGHRAVMLYCVQRGGCTHFRIASDLDAIYAKAFDAARTAGVEAIAFGTRMSPEGIWLGDQLIVDPLPQWPGIQGQNP
ncbi:MAG: DNA/RNA nuclease SfsA [Rhodobacteraceae bacterium]|nr:DNA/RNA nuclease SfsA [Paracoccaceae bacterium]